MDLDALRNSILKRVSDLGQGFVSNIQSRVVAPTQKFIQENPSPANYFAPRIANSIADTVQGTISPIPTNPRTEPLQAMRNVTAQTIREVGNQTPAIGQSMERLSPPGQLYTQAKGAINPQDQLAIVNQRAGDFFNSLKGIGLVTNGIVSNMAAGAINTGIQGVANKLDNKPFFDNYENSFAKGVTDMAAYGPLNMIVGSGIGQLGKIPLKPVQQGVRLIQSLDKPIVKFGNSSVFGQGVLRAMGSGVKGIAEGIASGTIRPLQKGETREQAIVNDALIFGAMGAATQAGGDITREKLKPIADQIGVSLKEYWKWLSGKGMKARANGDGYFLPGKGTPVRFASSTKLPEGQVVENGAVLGQPTGVQEPSSPMKMESAGGIKNLKVKQTKVTTEQPVLQTEVSPSMKIPLSPSQNKMGIDQSQQQILPSEGSSRAIIPPKVKIKPQQLNVNNLNISPGQKEEILSMQANKLKTTLGDKQIMDIASQVGIDTKSHTVDQTAKKIAEQLNLRRNVVSLENELNTMRQQGASQQDIIAKLQEIDTSSRLSAEQGTDIARQLRARKILANELDTPMQRIFKLLQNAGVNPDEYTKKAASVDFNNPGQVVDFYRSLVPAKASEWLDQLRYNSMLSSPNTHINNIFSNILNSGVVAPIEKTLTGTLDFLGSKVSGKQQTQFASEGPAYAKGYVSSLNDAAHRFADVMRGVQQSQNLDTKYLPIANGGVKGAIAKTLDLPMRLLEASDQFFTTLTAGGESAALKLRESKGINVGDIAGISKDNAAYRLFRSELNDPKQGALLKGIDHLTGLIMKARNDKSWVGTIAKFTIPFVKTPMNILKQMIEYSPAGVGTIPGAMNKTEQLSKALIGTSAAMGAAMLLASGRTTWAEPTDAKKKAAFRAAGMQPYAVKIGDNWVAYSKLPPALAANLALVSAIHDGIENKRLNQSSADAILSGVAKWGNFFADQSYLKSMGDLLAAVKGDPEKITSYFSNYPQQLVPFRALSGWVARIIDPYQRKVDTNGSVFDKQMQQLMMNIPGISMTVPARVDQNNVPIENQNRVLNAFSPMRITTENKQAKNEYETLLQKSKDTRTINDLRNQVEQTRGVAQEGNFVVFMGKDGKTHSIDLSFQPQEPQLTGSDALDAKLISAYKSDITKKENDIMALREAKKISDAQANEELSKLSQMKKRYTKAKFKKPAKIPLKSSSAIKTASKKLAKIRLSEPPKLKMPQVSFATPFTPSTAAPSVPNFKARIKFNV